MTRRISSTRAEPRTGQGAPLPFFILPPLSTKAQPMAIARKKLGAKPAPPVNPTLTRIAQMCESLQETVDAVQLDAIAELVSVASADPFPQEALALFKRVDDAQASLKTVMAYLTDRITAHRRAPGGFASGALMPQFSVTTKTSPKWKEEAIEASTEVANLKGVPFVEVQYLDRVKKKYPTTESLSVDVVASVQPLMEA